MMQEGHNNDDNFDLEEVRIDVPSVPPIRTTKYDMKENKSVTQKPATTWIGRRKSSAVVPLDGPGGNDGGKKKRSRVAVVFCVGFAVCAIVAVSILTAIGAFGGRVPSYSTEKTNADEIHDVQPPTEADNGIATTVPPSTEVKTDPSKCANPDAISTCEDCLNAGCTWSWGECITECDDEFCFNDAHFHGWKTEEICAEASQSKGHDEVEKPGAEAKQCVDAKSRSTCNDCLNAGCTWSWGECRTDCDDAFCFNEVHFLGWTPEEICAQAAPPKGDGDGGEQEDEVKPQCADAGSHPTCNDCLDAGCTWNSGECKSDCDDAFCYKTGYLGWTTDKICAEAPPPKAADEAEKEDDEVLQCVDADSHSTCGDCLGAGCLWTSGKCRSKCDDVFCFRSEFFPGWTEDEICETAMEKKADMEACSAQRTCGECTSTILPSSEDGSSTCMWYGNGGGGGWCASTCQMMGLYSGCGDLTCPKEP